jgi:transcriptional regulator with XRE-family HTH domain
LRDARRAIPVDAESLGNVLRFRGRVGRPVSQQEVAEAVGISRVWYTSLEAGRTARASVALLERLANVLMLDAEQRAAVFRFGLPELAASGAERPHHAVLEASARIRRTTRRLFAASSIEEALVIAAEETATHFGDAALVFYVRRLAPGNWEHPFIIDRGMGAQNSNLYAELQAKVGRDRFDHVVLYPALTEPGDVGTRQTFAVTSIHAAYEEAVARHKLQHWSLLHARIRSREGMTGGITVKHASERDDSDADQAVIGAIASLTSLALS